MNYKIYSLSFLLLCCNPVTNIQAQETEDIDEFNSFFDDSGNFDVDTSALRSCEIGEASTWVGYLDLLNVPQLFDEDFYRATHIPNYRNIINYPNFFLFSYQAPENQQITFHLFFNQSFKKNFTADASEQVSKNKTMFEDGRRLGSYLNIENGTFSSVIENDINLLSGTSQLPPALAPLKNINFPAVFNLLANAKLEERKAGFLAHYYKEISDKAAFEIKIPLLYEIRNLNYTEQEKKELNNAFSDFQGGDFDEVEFGKQHLVMDAFGTGTLDLGLRYKVWETDTTNLYVGASIYVPTDYRWTTGLYGTYFEPKDQQPVLRLCDLVEISAMPPKAEPDAKKTLEEYFLAALDHMSSAVLQCPMGYNNHLGFGLKVLPYWHIREDLKFNSVYLFEYLFAHEHPRFFIPQQSDVLFSTEFQNTGTDAAKLDLIERKLTERLFPRVFIATVVPGFIFNTVSNLQWTKNDWNFTIGYNGWYKSTEKLRNIKAPDSVIETLNLCKATADSASQLKLYGKIHKDITTKNHTISFSFYGNVTVWNNNLANDITLGLSFDKAF